MPLAKHLLKISSNNATMSGAAADALLRVRLPISGDLAARDSADLQRGLNSCWRGAEKYLVFIYRSALSGKCTVRFISAPPLQRYVLIVKL